VSNKTQVENWLLAIITTSVNVVKSSSWPGEQCSEPAAFLRRAQNPSRT